MNKDTSIESDPIGPIARGFTTLAPGDQRFPSWKAEVEAYQRERCPVYARYKEYRYLPVQAFKMADVATYPVEEAVAVFVSSGTAGQRRSRHHVKDLSIYEASVLSGFDRAVSARFGFDLYRPIILGHLPAYAAESSLVYMVRHLMEKRGASGSRFFLEEHGVLDEQIAAGRSILLFGAAFGLLDLLDDGHRLLPEGSVVIETGGMKTHRRSISRDDLHDRLSEGFGLPLTAVVSEYGMCELLSQCYTDPEGIFRTPPWMSFEIINPEDGRTAVPDGTPGALALFDLANCFTVSAILTQDKAVEESGGFRILGRLSEAELRGCNFLIES